MNWLLIFVPMAISLEFFAPESHLLVFLTSSLAILPLAGWMGRATEHLAARMGEGVGGLLNATFGNAAELIIALAALRAGLYDVVKASIAGSIVGNILLVLGAAMLAGGLGRLSVAISVVLLLVYLLYLVFVLITHSALFIGPYREEEKEAHVSVGRAVSMLAAATVGIAWMSEIMVAAIEPTAREFGLSNVFVAVFVFAILGNAAEHATPLLLR
jgi:Ca2+:H+ antiporter